MKKKILLWIACISVLCAMLAVSTSAFTDIDDQTTETAVATLRSMGIVTGTSATEYSPSLTLTRAQVCAMMIRTMDLASSTGSYTNQNLFTDVKSSMWHAGYVNLAYRQGIISGYGNGKFGPDDEVTYGQFVTMLLRLLGYTENDIGKVWPTDYISFAADLGIDENVSLAANDKVSRGNAAVLLYNTLMTKAKGANTEYYRTVGGYASSVTAILLDNHVSDSTAGDLQVCVIGNSGTALQYYDQKNVLSDAFIGSFGSLLLNSAGEAIGFIADGNGYTDIIIDSAKISGITDLSGNTYTVSGNVNVISDGSLYAYSAAGYVKVNAHAGQPARIYYDDNGSIAYIYLAAKADLVKTAAAVASSDAPAADFAEILGISSDTYHIVKNGGLADTAALAMYDVAYYDAMTDTLRVCDHKVTGYIESASPSVSAAETITVSGCTMDVMQCAWDTLADFKLGGYVTVLLADNGAVAAAYAADTVSADMYGVLSTDGSTVTLCGSGLTMKPSKVSTYTSYKGCLVRVNTSSAEKTTCSGVIRAVTAADTVDLAEKTVGGIALAPGCSIYESSGNGYVYSLEGVLGESSSDLSEIYWADSLDYTYVDFYHVNAEGLIDILVLSNVTGNYYTFGLLTAYTDEEGISIGKESSVYQNAMTVTNDTYPNESKKYICSITKTGGYGGIALAPYNSSYLKLASVSRTTAVKVASASEFYLTNEDAWYLTVSGTAIPVSEDVKVHVKTTDTWYSGEEGLLKALSAELTIEAYYDRTLTTGAQVRLIVLDAE